MDSSVKYLLSLRAIRERAAVTAHAAQTGNLNHFDYHENKMDDVVDFVISILNRDYGPDKFNEVYFKGRWLHFEVGGVDRITKLLETWQKSGCDDMELTRRLVDLFFVSVLLDAGAGDYWHYVDPETKDKYERSEGIAVASLHMFNSLMFTASKSSNFPLVDGKGLEELSTKKLTDGFQSSESNPLLGVESRALILRNLGTSLLSHPQVFGVDGRPGNIVDFMVNRKQDSNIDLLVFWDIIQDVVLPIWPKDRTVVSGHPVGDALPLGILKKANSPDDISATIQPFHKLTQWLTYSLMVPFERVLKMHWDNGDSLATLAEYRNGGLLVDFGALTLKEAALEQGRKASGQQLPLFDVTDDVIVEWRALTVALVDVVYEKVASRMPDLNLTFAQVLEAGVWKGGREIAAKRRPDTKSSPILLKTDGTVF